MQLLQKFIKSAELNMIIRKMGQQEVYDFLKNNKRKWFTSKDIARGLKVSIGSVTNNLKKLRKSTSVKFKFSNNKYYYMFKS
ncbi:HTH domain-containing protein [Candidatus Woesearchaeota archaeon]|nr:HTH domain-containing protein [Candidatus Woesearchaeota archaeon]